MEHTEIRRKLSAYLDGALDTKVRAEIEAHLAECDRCRAALADLKLTLAHLKNLPEVEPPPWLTAKIMTRVQNPSGQKQGFWQRLFLPLHIKLPLEALALVFICVTSYYLTRTNAPLAPLTEPPQLTRSEAPRPEPVQPAPAEPSGRSSAVSKPHTPAPQVTTGIPAAQSKQKEAATTFAPPPPTNASDIYAPPKIPKPQYRTPVISSRPAAEWAMPEQETIQREEALKYAREEKKASDLLMQKKGISGTRYSAEAMGGAQKGAAPSEYQPESGGYTEWVKPAEINLRVEEPAGAVVIIEAAVTHSGGKIIRRVYGETSHLLSVQIESQKFAELIGRLERIGKLQRLPQLNTGEVGTLDLFIRW